VKEEKIIMEQSLLYRSIMGDDEPTPARPIPIVPIIDDRRVLAVTKRSATTDRLIERLTAERAITSIFDDEMLSMMKDSTPQPQITLNTYPQLPAPVPEHVSDPRSVQCACDCFFCRSGSGHYNCQADEKCALYHLDVLSHLMPCDPVEETKVRRAALEARAKKIAQDRIAKHRSNLAPFVAKFKNDLRPYSTRVNPVLWENLLTAMASDVAKGLAMT